MNETLMEQLQRLERCVDALETNLAASRREGRMPSLEEARAADLLSREVMEILHAMPEQPCGGIADPALRSETAERLKAVQQKMAAALQPANASATRSAGGARKPLQAAAESIRAYGSY